MSSTYPSAEGRELVSILWTTGGRVELRYADGGAGVALAERHVTETIAREAGLDLVSSSRGTLRWAEPGRSASAPVA